jgi:hypothetical protein
VSKEFRDPVRNINPEILSNLEMVSTKVMPLPGGVGRRIGNEHDPRLSGLSKFGPTPVGDTTTYYEQIAVVRDKRDGLYYVAFRETPDALLVRNNDLEKFPEWLMKSKEKLREASIYIYIAKRHPKEVPVMRSHEDWLSPIVVPAVFDSIAYFLYKNSVIDDSVYGRFKQ